MCHHRESSPEWEALVERELRAEEEEEAPAEVADPDVLTEEESPDREPVEPSLGDD